MEGRNVRDRRRILQQHHGNTSALSGYQKATSFCFRKCAAFASATVVWTTFAMTTTTTTGKIFQMINIAINKPTGLYCSLVVGFRCNYGFLTIIWPCGVVISSRRHRLKDYDARLPTLPGKKKKKKKLLTFWVIQSRRDRGIIEWIKSVKWLPVGAASVA